MFALSSAAATTNETMLMTLNTHMFPAEATSVATVLPSRQSFDEKGRSGDVLALPGRYAR
jgi:hypothetical protein